MSPGAVFNRVVYFSDMGCRELVRRKGTSLGDERGGCVWRVMFGFPSAEVLCAKE